MYELSRARVRAYTELVRKAGLRRVGIAPPKGVVGGTISAKPLLKIENCRLSTEQADFKVSTRQGINPWVRWSRAQRR